jgi:hypothetical protein
VTADASGSDLAMPSVEAPEDVEEFLEFAMEQGWGDGLPLVPPTYERVERMLAASSSDPDELVGLIPPRGGQATVRQIAVNSVMAGCRPEYLPVVVTAIRCIVRPEWNLQAIQATTHPAAPLVVIHGPIAERIGANWGYGCFGPGNRANASIGRAVRLVLLNIGGGRPGDGDQSVQGQPSKYTYCIAENVEDSPWPAFHTTRGLDAEQSAVTVFGGTNPENVNDHVSGPEGILLTMSSVIATMGSNNTWNPMCEVACVFGPEHAQTIAREGWTREDVAHYLFEHARLPLRTLKRGGQWGMHYWPRWMLAETDDDALMPVAHDAADLLVWVAGALGKHSSVVKAFAENRSVTQAIESGAL